MDNEERKRAAQAAWGMGHALGRGHGSTSRMTGSMRVTPRDLEAMRQTAEAHEEMHREARRRHVERMKLLLASLTEEEWAEVKRRRDSGRTD